MSDNFAFDVTRVESKSVRFVVSGADFIAAQKKADEAASEYDFTQASSGDAEYLLELAEAPAGSKTMTREERYMASNEESLCPACLEEGEIEGDSIEIEGIHAHQPMFCNVCEAGWTDKYKLVGITEAEGFDPSELICPVESPVTDDTPTDTAGSPSKLNPVSAASIGVSAETLAAVKQALDVFTRSDVRDEIILDTQGMDPTESPLKHASALLGVPAGELVDLHLVIYAE